LRSEQALPVGRKRRVASALRAHGAPVRWLADAVQRIKLLTKWRSIIAAKKKEKLSA